MTYGELYRRGRDALEAAGVPEAELDAWSGSAVRTEATCWPTGTESGAPGSRRNMKG